jgi:hypothetical protein
VKERFLRLERLTTGASMALACLMLVIAASLGMFQIITRFILERPAESEVLIRFSLLDGLSACRWRSARRHGGVDALYASTTEDQPARLGSFWLP